jgi:hypothetical protein
MHKDPIRILLDSFKLVQRSLRPEIVRGPATAQRICVARQIPRSGPNKIHGLLGHQQSVLPLIWALTCRVVAREPFGDMLRASQGRRDVPVLSLLKRRGCRCWLNRATRRDCSFLDKRFSVRDDWSQWNHSTIAHR